MGVCHAFLIFSLLLAAPDRVSISVTPQAVPVNGTIRLTCTVPRHPDNRVLVMGVYYDGSVVYRASERQLDGESAPITHTMYVDHLPCDAVVAQCYLLPAIGRQYRAVQALTIAGCTP